MKNRRKNVLVIIFIILFYRLLTVIENDEEVQLYSIHSNPLNSNEFCVCGHSSSVRLYDRRNVKNNLHILYPEHLVPILII